MYPQVIIAEYTNTKTIPKDQTYGYKKNKPRTLEKKITERTKYGPWPSQEREEERRNAR